jgi:hypothetical protein
MQKVRQIVGRRELFYLKITQSEGSEDDEFGFKVDVETKLVKFFCVFFIKIRQTTAAGSILL